MPQDSRRSVVKYRSFVTCDDPKGVVENKTIRKSKAGSLVEGQTMPKSLNMMNRCSSSYKREKEEMGSKGTQEGLNDPSSFQVMEVSRGAHKLNQVIDSWSKGINIDGGSKDIARDLLKGALGLQESLIMLGKLQEASNYMAKLKKKQKEKSHEVGIERMSSNRFGNQNYQMGNQNPRDSTYGSSRDCYAELREVIRDSLARQNLLPNSSSQEKAYFHRQNLLPNSPLQEKAYLDKRKKGSSPDMPSTSSSRSSMFHSHDFGSSECSFSSKGYEEKQKGSNLIAKLMGLEDFPSKSSKIFQEQLEREKISNEKRPIFDIDMPKANKPEFVAQKMNRERLTLEEIIGTMQFKGVLNSNKHPTYHQNTSHLEKRFAEDAPPIVIMRPFRSSIEPEQEGALLTEEMCRNWRTKEEVSSAIMDHRTRDLNSNEMRRKLTAEETRIKKLRVEKGANSKREVAKFEDKEVKIKENILSNKMKASVPLSAKLPQKKEAIEKKVDRIQRMEASRSKPIEMEGVKSRSVSKILEQGKVALTKQKKSESKSHITRNQISQQKSTSQNSVSKKSAPIISHNSIQRKKNVKSDNPVSKPLAINVENIGCKAEDIQIEFTCGNESDRTTADINTPAVQLSIEEENEASEIVIREICDNSQNYVYEPTLPTTQDETGTKSPEEANKGLTHITMERDNLLLSSPSFLSHADELFDINAYIPVISRTNCLQDSQVCHGTESVRSHAELAGENFPSDSVYAVLERDLLGNRVAKGAWDIGWRDGFSVAEVDEVVGAIDKIIFIELVEELLTDFVILVS